MTGRQHSLRLRLLRWDVKSAGFEVHLQSFPSWWTPQSDKNGFPKPMFPWERNRQLCCWRKQDRLSSSTGETRAGNPNRWGGQWGGQQLRACPSLVATSRALNPAAARGMGRSRERKKCLEPPAHTSRLGFTLEPICSLNLPHKGEVSVVFSLRLVCWSHTVERRWHAWKFDRNTRAQLREAFRTF